MSENLFPQLPILVVDDEAYIVSSVIASLKAEGISNVFGLQDSSEVLPFLESREVGIVLLDLSMPALSGEELLPMIREEHPDVAVLVITGNRDVDRAVACMREGALDYLTKPVERPRLASTLRRIIENRELMRENRVISERLLRGKSGRHEAFSSLVTADPAMEAVMGYAEAIAPSSHPVLITGETGTGKELFARALHDLSGCGGEFVPLNAAGLDDAFFSDALFGHKAGAFTGAQRDLDGFIDRAKNGTLFLDEMGDLSLASQVKLLRVIETGEYYAVGSDMMKRCKARIVAATNKDLAEECGAGHFRKDLYYRLRDHHIRIPPLRERLDDIPILVERFCAQAAAERGRAAPLLPKGLYPLLSSYEYPGNVRELKSMVVDAVNRSGVSGLSLRVFKDAIGTERSRAPRELVSMRFPMPLPSIKKVTELLIAEALLRAEGNQAAAARLLGISPQAMSSRMKGKKAR